MNNDCWAPNLGDGRKAETCPHCGSRSFAWLNVPPDVPTAARCSDCSVAALFDELRDLDNRIHPPNGFRRIADTDERLVMDLHALVLKSRALLTGTRLTSWEARALEPWLDVKAISEKDISFLVGISYSAELLREGLIQLAANQNYVRRRNEGRDP